MSPGNSFTSTPKRNIHDHKALLCIWWDQQGVVYYELLKPNETVTADVYRRQLNKLNDELLQNWPAVASNRRTVLLLHDNGRSHVARVVQDILLQLKWEVLPHSVLSPDIAPSEYHLFRSMQHGLAGHGFEMMKKCENGSLNGLLPNQHPSFDADLPCCQKVIENEGKYFG